MNLSDNFHCTSNTEFAARTSYYHDEQKEELAHGQAFSVVRGGVWPTTKTPRQITAMPAQRRGGTTSPNRK